MLDRPPSRVEDEIPAPHPGPLVEPVKGALPHNSSALILVAEPKTTEELVSVVGARSRQVLRQALMDEQVVQLKQAAVRT